MHTWSLSSARLLFVFQRSRIALPLPLQSSATFTKLRNLIRRQILESMQRDYNSVDLGWSQESVYTSIPGGSWISLWETLAWTIHVGSFFSLKCHSLSLSRLWNSYLFPKAPVKCNLLSLLVRINNFFLCAPRILSTYHFYQMYPSHCNC